MAQAATRTVVGDSPALERYGLARPRIGRLTKVTRVRAAIRVFIHGCLPSSLRIQPPARHCQGRTRYTTLRGKLRRIDSNDIRDNDHFADHLQLDPGAARYRAIAKSRHDFEDSFLPTFLRRAEKGILQRGESQG